MTKYQNYKHFKLPITLDPLKYGKLIFNLEAISVVQINKSNLALITEYDELNHVKLFKQGDFLFEYKDFKSTDPNSFVRSIENNRFTYKNNELFSMETLSVVSILLILFVIFIKLDNYNNYPMAFIPFFKLIEKNPKYAPYLFILFLILFVIFPDNSEIITSMSVGMSHNIIKLRKVKSKNIWKDLIFNINNKVFTKSLFESKFNELLTTLRDNFTENNHMFILFKIKYNNGEISSIGKLQRITLLDLSWYIDFIIENMKFKSEYYNETQIDSFIFSYGFKDGKIKAKDSFIENINFQKYKNYDLPISMNPTNYGRIIYTNKIDDGMLYFLQNDNGYTIRFNKYENYNLVEFFKSGISVVNFHDEKINENKFLRKLDNKSFYFLNGIEILTTKEIKTKFIEKTKKSTKLINNFITLDIETLEDNNVLIPYLICFYDGNKSYSFWLGDYDNVENMILDCLQNILTRKYNGYKVYIHNMANFDIIFLLKYLVKLGSLNPVIHNGKIISLKVSYGKYHIEFKDSYLLLLKNLRDLSKGFKVDTIKSIFPHLFINNNNLNYIGEVPIQKYFGKKIKLNEYNDYKNNFKNNWSLKNESIKYCEIDCISLFQIILKFNELIFNLFSKNIHHYPTLPSLAFAIFRSNFMYDKNIPQLSGEIANDIRSGYTGGAVDVYIPFSKPGNKIKCLDVNSLYPSQMYDKFMPVGNPTYFSGDINMINNNAFGFFYCEIIAPDDIKHPIIQTHVKTDNGIRTMAPIGNWSDMLFSEEIYNARKYGYQIEILWGYTFEKGNIFKEYVEYLHNLRNNYSRSDPLNYIAKILLNSLYGRFGMDDNFCEINIIHKDYFPDFENKFIDNIENKIELGDYWLVIYKNIDENEDIGTHNVSIGIASAITAYARIHMSQFKNNPKINLYYTDTDSIFTDSEIDDNLISDKILGKLKIENISEEAIFLSPKVYCLKVDNGKTIYKAKGLKHEVELTMNDFNKLLYKNTLLEKTQTKWFRKLSEGKINLLEELYTLKVNDNKRQLIFDINNKFIGTKPHRISKDKDIRSKSKVNSFK